MQRYVIGDLQGCYDEFQQLLQIVDFNPSQDRLYLVGDLIARGPNSLACLEYVVDNASSVFTTLGNHDLHFLACQRLNKAINPKDKLESIVASPRRSEFCDYLQQQPLAIWLESYRSLICHAGLSPELPLQQALQFAHQAQQAYQGNDADYYLANMYRNTPSTRNQIASELDAFCYTVNCFTRMRFVNKNGQLELNYKGHPDQHPELIPWFNYHPQNHKHINVLFGHWAALNGTTHQTNTFALDTGCVWGNKLSLLDLNSKDICTVDAKKQ